MLPEQQDPFHFRMHAQRVCIIAAYPVLRLCDAGNIAALSAHGVSNTELPHEFSSSVEILRTMPQAFLPASHTHTRYPKQPADKHFFVLSFRIFSFLPKYSLCTGCFLWWVKNGIDNLCCISITKFSGFF